MFRGVYRAEIPTRRAFRVVKMQMNQARHWFVRQSRPYPNLNPGPWGPQTELIYYKTRVRAQLKFKYMRPLLPGEMARSCPGQIPPRI